MLKCATSPTAYFFLSAIICTCCEPGPHISASRELMTQSELVSFSTRFSGVVAVATTSIEPALFTAKVTFACPDESVDTSVDGPVRVKVLPLSHLRWNIATCTLVCTGWLS